MIQRISALNLCQKFLILPRQSADLPRQTSSRKLAGMPPRVNLAESIANLLKNILEFCLGDMPLKYESQTQLNQLTFFSRKNRKRLQIDA